LKQQSKFCAILIVAITTFCNAYLVVADVSCGRTAAGLAIVILSLHRRADSVMFCEHKVPVSSHKLCA